MKQKAITARERELINRHLAAPLVERQAEVMRKLGLDRDYHAFTSLVYRVVRSNK